MKEYIKRVKRFQDKKNRLEVNITNDTKGAESIEVFFYETLIRLTRGQAKSMAVMLKQVLEEDMTLPTMEGES